MNQLPPPLGCNALADFVNIQHISGSAKPVEGNDASEVPTSLLPGLSLKSAFSYKKSIDFWRSQTKKLKLVQPFDVFLSNPHVSASAVIGAVGTVLFGDNALRPQVIDEQEGFKRFNLYASGMKSAIMGDLFATLSLTAHHGNFQRLLFDLSRVHLRLDVPSGSKFLSAAACVAQNLYESKQPPFQAVHALCPNATVSLQQQVMFMKPVKISLKDCLACRKNYGSQNSWKITLYGGHLTQ